MLREGSPVFSWQMMERYKVVANPCFASTKDFAYPECISVRGMHATEQVIPSSATNGRSFRLMCSFFPENLSQPVSRVFWADWVTSSGFLAQ